MLLGRNHPRDRKRRQGFRLVLDVLDFEPDHGELVGKLFQRLVGVEMFLQPGEREFHDVWFSCPLSPLRGGVRGGALSATAVVRESKVVPDAVSQDSFMTRSALSNTSTRRKRSHISIMSSRNLPCRPK